VAAVLAVAVTLGISVFAASYDSSEDPLISLSYLMNIFKPEIEKDYKEKNAELESTVASLENKITLLEQKLENTTVTPPAETTPEDDAPSAQFEVIELTWGEALYAVSACEIILRAGEAYCIAPDATQGLANLTTAAEIYNGQPLTKNHHLLIPRGDGRGLMANSQSVFIMVRGEYKIVEG